MKCTGKLDRIDLDYKTKQPKITLLLNGHINLEEIQDKDKLSIEIKQFKKKRSLNSNAYAWYLITELANVMRMSKEEMYFRKLKEYGQSDLVLIAAEVPAENYLKYYEEAGETTVNTRVFKWYKVYKGSSEFDSKEMSIFLDGIVQDCKEQGISTLEDREIERMCEIWGGINK